MPEAARELLAVSPVIPVVGISPQNAPEYLILGSDKRGLCGRQLADSAGGSHRG